jgi:hypothetical protein
MTQREDDVGREFVLGINSLRSIRTFLTEDDKNFKFSYHRKAQKILKQEMFYE